MLFFMDRGRKLASERSDQQGLRRRRQALGEMNQGLCPPKTLRPRFSAASMTQQRLLSELCSNFHFGMFI